MFDLQFRNKTLRRRASGLMCNNKVDPLNKSFADKQGVPDVSTVVPPNTAVLGTGEKCKCSPLLSGPFSR